MYLITLSEKVLEIKLEVIFEDFDLQDNVIKLIIEL